VILVTKIMAERLITEVFGKRLKHARQSRNYTREELAGLMQTDKSHIWRLENGRTNPRLDTIVKICEVLGIAFSTLVPTPKSAANDDLDFIEFYKSQNKDTQAKIRKISEML